MAYPKLDLAGVLDVLVEVSEALDQRSDIEDSQDGEDLSPAPNWAMRLGQMVGSAIEALQERLSKERREHGEREQAEAYREERAMRSEWRNDSGV